MATFEENSIAVGFSDDDGYKAVEDDTVVQEENASNNSTSEKTGKPSGSKSPKSRNRKPKLNSGDQNTRRDEILSKTKGKQYVYTNHTKNFLSAVMRPNMDGRDIKAKVFKNQLMMSEGMDEVPSGFAKNWLMVVCPFGSRCLVVASRGYTGAYTKTGYHIISHPSSLPMGNKMFQGYGPCVLDCIYCNETETYYVIDLMVWDGQALYNCDTQARFKILMERIQEYDLSRPSPMNPYPLVPLKTFTPTKNNIQGAVSMAPYVIDGLIFYHKQLTYQPGPTPLMLWMTLDRLPSKMRIEIPAMGIVSSVSYKDPVALALAHGVSPTIISQVYPGSNPFVNQNQGRNTRGVNGQGRTPYHQQPYNSQPQRQGYDQSGYRLGASSGNNQAFGPNDFAFLNDVMMNLNLAQQGMMGQGQGRPNYRRNFNSFNSLNANTNNSNSFYQPMGFGRQQSQPFFKSKQQQQNNYQQRKKKKQNSSHRRNDESMVSNWTKPHSVMRSQWMETKPDDYEEDYLTCICPLSKRRIIVAAKGSTCLYNKFGKLIETYSSTLPNGSPSSQAKTSDELTILDCLWCGPFQKFFVIDLMHWRSQPFYDAEAEFRFFWMSDKIAGVKLKSGKREYSLEILPKYPSDEASLVDALSKTDFKVDGLLSFQRRSKYSLELPASAVWLRLDMLQELLGYDPPTQVKYKPSSEKEKKQRAYFIEHNAEGAAKGDNVDQLANGVDRLCVNDVDDVE